MSKLTVVAAGAKNAVVRHKTKIAVAATAVVTATVCVAMNRSEIKQHDEFLKNHGLYDEYYAIDMYPTETEA